MPNLELDFARRQKDAAARTVCPHCQHSVVPETTSRWWKVAAPLGYVLAAVLLIAAGWLGPIGVLAVPLVFAIGFGAAAAHRQAVSHPRCPVCREDLPRQRHHILSPHPEPRSS